MISLSALVCKYGFKLLEDTKAGEEEKLRREQKKIEQENRQKQIEFEWKQQQLKVQRERQQNRQLLEEKESIHQEPEVISKCKTIVTDNPKQEDFLDEETKVVSKEGQRYLLCTRCNKIKKSIAFSSIDFIPGSKERSNRGICRECEDSFCPRCGKKLIKRNGKHGEFFGCSGYPNCRFTKSIY